MSPRPFPALPTPPLLPRPIVTAAAVAVRCGPGGVALVVVGVFHLLLLGELGEELVLVPLDPRDDLPHAQVAVATVGGGWWVGRGCAVWCGVNVFV
jgi:hypothetical protein